MRFSRNIFCSSVLALCLVACSDDSVAINDAIVAISSSSETFNESSSEMSGNSVVSSSGVQGQLPLALRCTCGCNDRPSGACVRKRPQQF